LQYVDRLAGLAIGLLGGAVVLTARAFPNVPGQDLGASTLPMIVGAGFIACGALLVRRSFVASRYVAGAGLAPRASERIGPPLAMLAAILVYVLLSERLGYPLVAPASILIGLLALRVRPIRAIAWSLGASLLVHLAFYKMLRVPLPWGMVPPLY